MTTPTLAGTCHSAWPRRRYPRLPGGCRPPTPQQNKENNTVTDDALVYSPDRPWLPPAIPLDFPKGRLTPEWVGEVVKGTVAAPLDLVLRSHLVKMRPNDVNYMAAWRTFWRTLAFANRRRVLVLLQEWLAAAQAARELPDLPEEEAVWIRRFIPNVESGIARLEKSRNEPMAWAGARYAKYPPEQRARVEALIGAIVLHRDGDIDDNELYNILGSLRVDPKDRRGGIEEENLERIMDACIDAEPLDLESTYWIPPENQRRIDKKRRPTRPASSNN